MHDGGTHLNLYINDVLVCNSTQIYGKGAGSHAKMESMQAMGPMQPKPISAPAPVPAESEDVDAPLAPQATDSLEKRDRVFGGDHITHPGVCTDFGEVRVGDVVRTESFYDFDIHTMMTHRGRPEKIMGNMRVFMGPM
jgi:hypothetical protein